MENKKETLAGSEELDAGANLGAPEGPDDAASEGPDDAAPEGASDAASDDAALQELAENNALADVFDDVRACSRASQLVRPERWEEQGMIPAHMTAEEFEMFVFEYVEDYRREHKAELDAERAARRAKASSVRSSKKPRVGCAPAIPNRRLKQIEEDEARARDARAAAQGGGAEAENSAATSDDASASASALPRESAAAVGVPMVSQPAGELFSEDSRSAEVRFVSSPEAPGGENGHVAAVPAGAQGTEAQGEASAPAAEQPADDDPFANLKIPDGYKLVELEGEYVLVPDESAAPRRREVDCRHIVALVGQHSYYLYDSDFMTDRYAHWAFLASEDNPLATFVDCVREEGRTYPRPLAAEDLGNAPFRMSPQKVQATWEAVRDSGDYPDVKRTEASNGDVFYFSTLYLSEEYARSLAEYIAVDRPAAP